jgi:CxxC motif-containing protein (DUF1111 family)
MFSLASIRRTLPTGVTNVTCSAVGICSLTLLLSVCVGVDADDPAKKPSSPSEEKGAGQPAEAPAGFDNKTNGFEDQGAFNKDRDSFEEVETIEKGLGPVFNATSCVSCHQNPVTGSSSQIAELRAGHRKPAPDDPNPRRVEFVEAEGGSVIQQRAIDPAIQEHVSPEDDVRTLRMSNSVLGSGFVEVIPDQQLLKIKNEQRRWGMEGFAVVVSAAVAPTRGPDGKDDFVLVERIGRFGWKCQEASLLNFSAGAYVVEMGITSPLQPQENTSNGRDVSMFDKVPDPEDKKVDPEDPHKVEHPFGVDVESFTRFMRSTKVPPRDAALVGTPDVVEGEKLFRDNQALGCAICHHPDYTTPPAGSPIRTLDGRRGSDMATVPDALGNKVIHPYSDFLLHDIGTGDGIAQTQHADLPPRGYENRHKIPEDLKNREGIVRVLATPERGLRRVLRIESPGLEQRTANKMRTAPLWGLRVRPQLMHDGLSLTIDDAIRKHSGQAEGARLKYQALPEKQTKQLLAFLNSL